MSLQAHKMAAIMLATWPSHDRQWALKQLSPGHQRSIGELIDQIKSLGMPLDALSCAELLQPAQPIRSDEEQPTLVLRDLLASLPLGWATRVLAAWQIDDSSVNAHISDPVKAQALSKELRQHPRALPAKLSAALREISARQSNLQLNPVAN